MKNNSEQDKGVSRSRNVFWAFLLIPLAIYFFFGLQHLAKFETADEHYWIYSNYNNNDYWNNNDGRIHQYWDALFKGNWKKTRINDKPGITLAYVSGVGSYLKTNLNKQIVTGQIPAMAKADKAEKVNLYFRLPILIFNGLFSIFLYFLLKKLLESRGIAFLTVTFILLSPIILGISQIVNPDALLWEFAFAAIVSFLIFLRDSSKKLAALAAFFLGLSLLTKYSSVILIPFFFAVMFLWFTENIKTWSAEQRPREIMRYALLYLAIIAGGLLVYAVILPDNLVQFRHFMKGSLGFKGMQWLFLLIFGLDLAVIADAHFLKSRVLRNILENFYIVEKYFKKFIFIALPVVFLMIISNTLFGSDWLRLFSVPFDAASSNIFSKLSYKRIFLMQFRPIIFSLSPLIIAGIVYAGIKEAVKPSKFQWVAFVFSLFILIFIAASMQQELPLTIRYSIILYPMAMLIAAIGIYQAVSLGARSRNLKIAFFAFLILIGSASLLKSKPFYFNYTNFLLPKKFIITDAWGYGGYEAAQQLNKIPGANQMRIWSDYNGVCLFFNGRCEANNLTMKNIRKKSLELPRFEYFVSSRRGRILAKNLWNSLPEEYQSAPVWSLVINERPENSLTIYENGIYKKE